MTLRIQSRHLDRLRQEGESSYPQETCGVLVGQAVAGGLRIVEEVLPCANASLERPDKQYSIAPAELLRAQRQAREAGRAIIGFYHSHPDSPARWSRSDLAEAHWTGCSYVIVGMECGAAVAVNSFLLVAAADGKRFEEEAIEVY